MGKMTIAIVAALIAACAAPQQKALPQIPSVQPQVQSPVAVPTATTPQPTSYLVRLNFVLFTDEIAASPVTSHAFEEAIQTWANDLPVQCGIYLDEVHPLLPINALIPTISDMPGIVHVRIVDIHAQPWLMEEGVLGFWDYQTNNLVLDKGLLEMDPDMAYSVCLHELGHVFGLPHLENESAQFPLSGEIMVPDEFDASRMVMYPIYDPDKNKRATLSDLEIEIATKNLLGLQQLLHNGCSGLTKN